VGAATSGGWCRRPAARGPDAGGAALRRGGPGAAQARAGRPPAGRRRPCPAPPAPTAPQAGAPRTPSVGPHGYGAGQRAGLVERSAHRGPAGRVEAGRAGPSAIRTSSSPAGPTTLRAAVEALVAEGRDPHPSTPRGDLGSGTTAPAVLARTRAPPRARCPRAPGPVRRWAGQGRTGSHVPSLLDAEPSRAVEAPARRRGLRASWGRLAGRVDRAGGPRPPPHPSAARHVRESTTGTTGPPAARCRLQLLATASSRTVVQPLGPRVVLCGDHGVPGAAERHREVRDVEVLGERLVEVGEPAQRQPVGNRGQVVDRDDQRQRATVAGEPQQPEAAGGEDRWVEQGGPAPGQLGGRADGTWASGGVVMPGTLAAATVGAVRRPQAGARPHHRRHRAPDPATGPDDAARGGGCGHGQAGEAAEAGPGGIGRVLAGGRRDPVAVRDLPGQWVDADGTSWRLRGGEPPVKRVEHLLRSPDVPVLHFYGPDAPTEVAEADREALWQRVRPYLRQTVQEPDDHTSFDVAEFKDGRRRYMLVIEESADPTGAWCPSAGGTGGRTSARRPAACPGEVFHHHGARHAWHAVTSGSTRPAADLVPAEASSSSAVGHRPTGWRALHRPSAGSCTSLLGDARSGSSETLAPTGAVWISRHTGGSCTHVRCRCTSRIGGRR
jgi:hypothetical protein